MHIFDALVVPPILKLYAVKCCQSNVWDASDISFEIVVKYLVVTEVPSDFTKRELSGDNLNLCILIYS